MAGEIIRAPVYVTTAWKRWAAPDVVTNVAALVFIAAAPVPHPSPDPTFYKRPALQIEQFPNLAVKGTEVVQKSVPEVYGQTFAKRAPQIDLPPNLAVRAALGYLPPPGIDWTPPRRLAAAPDLYPNVAIRASAEAVKPPSLQDMQPTRKGWVQPDLAPNLAVRSGLPVYVPPGQLDPPQARKGWAAPELYPNVAVRFVVEPIPLPTVLDLAPARKAAPVPDLYPNIAVGIAVAVYVPPPQLDIAIARRGTQPDLAPNIAVQVQGYVPQSSPEPATRRALAGIDLYPNLAVNAPIPASPLLLAVEPWINKRFAPQVEVFQNRAVYAPVEAIVPPSNQVQAEPARFRGTPAPDIYPNLAVNAPIAPPPPAPGAAGNPRRKRYGVIDGTRLLIFATQGQAAAARSAIESGRISTTEAPIPALRRINVAPPLEVVPLKEVEQVAQAARAGPQFRRLLKAHDSTAIARQWEHWRAREEEDIARAMLVQDQTERAELAQQVSAFQEALAQWIKSKRGRT